MNLENNLDDYMEELNEAQKEDNEKFLRCDNKTCDKYGEYPLCYFHIYYNCYLYETKHL